MTSTLSILTLSGAIEKDKFKTTVTQIEPSSQRVIFEQDHEDTSVSGMANVMHSLAKDVLSQQQVLNKASGKDYSVPVIMGWTRGAFFDGLDKVLKQFPNEKLQAQHVKERDKGALISAVDKARQDLNLGEKAYLSRYSNVYSTQLPEGFKPEVDDAREAEFKELKSRAGEGGGSNEALEELQEHFYDNGRQTVTEAEHHSGRCLKADDDMMDSRFTVTGNLNAGPEERGLLQLWDLRQQFARGFKDQARIKPNHVMCVKELGVNDKDRPLQNVAEATAYQLLINNGVMTRGQLKDPYT